MIIKLNVQLKENIRVIAKHMLYGDCEMQQ